MRDNVKRSRVDTAELAILRWWRSKRPCAFDVAEHLENPTVNTVTDSEEYLALLAAKIYANRRRA